MRYNTPAFPIPPSILLTYTFFTLPFSVLPWFLTSLPSPSPPLCLTLCCKSDCNVQKNDCDVKMLYLFHQTSPTALSWCSQDVSRFKRMLQGIFLFFFFLEQEPSEASISAAQHSTSFTSFHLMQLQRHFAGTGESENEREWRERRYSIVQKFALCFMFF